MNIDTTADTDQGLMRQTKKLMTLFTNDSRNSLTALVKR